MEKNNLTDCCPVCKKNNFEISGKAKTNKISKVFIDKDYKIVQCSNCDVYYVNPHISFTQDQWGKLYNNEYFSNQTKWLIKKRHLELVERFNTAEKFLSTKNVKRFLDIGTGEGKALVEAKKRKWECYAIDISDNRINDAKGEDIIFHKRNLLESNFPDNFFNFIYLDSVLEHSLNPLEYLIEINRILNKEGVVYVGVPNEDCLFNDIRKIIFFLIGRKNLSSKIKPFDSPYHVVGFNERSLRFALHKSELEIKLLKNIGRSFDFLGSSPMQKTFWIRLFFLLPFELIAKLVKRDVYFGVYVKKINLVKCEDD